MKGLSLIVASLVSWAGIASALVINTTVDGMAGPWQWEDGGLNTAYQYCYGEQAAPVVISKADGFRFSVGDNLTISYLSGTVAIGLYGPWFDALGDPGYPLNDQTNNYPPAPSYYMDHSTYPIHGGELVGTFANDSGQIVGTPFAVGNLATLTIPTGATRLQLGVNDDNFYDNSGSWSIQISGAAVPEPATCSLLALGVLALLGTRRLHHRLAESAAMTAIL